MASFFILAIPAYSFVILGFLFYIDLKTRLLPNKFVLQFLFAGIAFHIVSGFSQNSPLDLLVAAICSASLLLAIRAFGNKMYNIDTLGMGDVKLLSAAGIWLGTEYIFLAITLGALVGVFHGLGVVFYSRLKSSDNVALGSLSIPAGPGFIVGIVVCVALKYHVFIASLM